MSTMLHSGVGIQKAVELASTKTYDARTRHALEAVSKEVANGTEVTEAMRRQNVFPSLMLDMVEVGEKTGALPEVLESLANHYENNLRLRRTFYFAIAWPMFQLIAAILVIALAIWLIGWFSTPESREFDILGLGLYGTSGAVIWLFSTFGTLAAIVVGYQLFKRTVAAQQILHPLLLQIPLIGYCMRSFAIARFSWAFALTQQAGMQIEESLKSSLRATSNGAFIAATKPMWDSIKDGDTLSHAMAESRLFPDDYLHMVEVAEQSGTVPEMLDRLSPKFEDQARRALEAMAAMLGWGVWMLVAAFIIFLIFNVVLRYIGMIQTFTNDAMK
ncbi:MAG: type II secretion system F family protein [Planctomycetaceae bacterium]